ncbi:MAG: hypothetical protein EA426_13170 [Spirochaetaceae bacterium]|nr:MAG: hypothetical protein EA426_13170 [Spirochaetaceae bacterium]
MDFVVLVKYVADVERIPEDAWDTERGLLRRGRLRMVANPLDDRALRLALEIRDSAGAARPDSDRGKVVVISMGPLQAEEICRRALAHGADHAVLLSDRAFAGADTIATARTIAAALRRLVADEVVRRPLVIAGMQSPDGDTAQVPIQVAALLRYPVIPYVTAWSAAPDSSDSGPVSFETLQPVGRGRLTLRRTPALATVTSFLPELPRYVSLERMSRASEADLPVWGREDLGIAEAHAGLAGSRTRVVEIFSPPKTGRRGYRVEFGGERNPLEELPVVLEQLERYLRTGGVPGDSGEAPAVSDTPASDTARAAPDTREQGAAQAVSGPDDAARETETGERSYYRGECVVLCERDAETGEVNRCSLELLGAVTGLADELSTRATALVPGGIRPGEQELLARSGADTILSVGADFSRTFVPEEHARAAAYALRRIRSQVVLVPATLAGRVVAPLLAAYLGAGLTADCTGLKIADYRGRAGGRDSVYRKVLFQTRPALGGNVMATIVSLRGRENGAPQMVSARPGVFAPIVRDDASAALKELTPTAEELEAAGSVELAADPGEGEGRVEPDRDHGEAPADEPGAAPAGEPGAAPASEPGAPPETETPLEECDVIVSVGLGIGGKENVDRLARPLVRALERAWGVAVGLGCSRAAMEAGYLPHSVQVGQTGKTVRPRLYIALGISGAVQHRVGMENAGQILSINSDDEAPLLSSSDYVIRARCEEAIPVLLRLLQDDR